MTPRGHSDNEWPDEMRGGAPRGCVQDQLAVHRQRELGRELGSCGRCGEPVRSQQNFMREDGTIAHVRCHATHSPTR